MAQRALRTPNTGTIVFVCEHGTAKSVIAMAYFESIARARGLAFRAVSRGMDPDPAVPRNVRDGLRGDNLALGAFVPTRLATADLEAAALVISFDRPEVAALARGRAAVQSWDGLPSVSASYALARHAIRRRVEALVDSLASIKR